MTKIASLAQNLLFVLHGEIGTNFSIYPYQRVVCPSNISRLFQIKQTVSGICFNRQTLFYGHTFSFRSCPPYRYDADDGRRRIPR